MLIFRSVEQIRTQVRVDVPAAIVHPHLRFVIMPGSRMDRAGTVVVRARRDGEISLRHLHTTRFRRVIPQPDRRPARHAHELLAAPLPLRDIASYRRYLEETPALTDHLTDLGEQHVPAMYLDPLSNVLAVNKPMALALPGLEDVGNLAIYWFLPVARQLFPDWPAQADYIVGRLKAGMGRYRTAPQARKLLRTLSKTPEFTARWISSTRIAYNWETSDHIRWKNPGTGEEKIVSVHRAEISEKAVMILYSAYINRHTSGPG
ncbi:hypothetical protein ACFYXQ_09040 [Nocardia jiangxiensis]|uniref:MmyB-like transcription regulator ligand binding domain-containing protein n=1 Tax=Nocardia jiangxiensis TaxID=282685 RepID=A0ABW6RV64_9NOCA